MEGGKEGGFNKFKKWLWMHAGVAKHERSVRVARGVPERNSSFLSALQTPQVLL